MFLLIKFDENSVFFIPFLVCEIDLANHQSNVCINKNALDAKVRPGKPAYCGPCHEAQCVSSLIGNKSAQLIVPARNSISKNVIRNVDLNLFPNPSSGNFNVDLSGLELNLKSNISIYTALGNCIYNHPFNSTDRVSIQLDSRLAPNGIYILILNTPERTIEKRFVIQR